jgi:hypothetical protein
MRKMLLVLCVLLLALMAVSIVAAQDDEETSLALPTLEDGVPVEGTFEDSTMQVYFFVGSEGDLVSVWMEQESGSTLDPFVILLGPNGEVIAYNDDTDNADMETFASEIIEAELPVDGAYLVVATAFTEVREPTIPAGESLEEALNYTLTVSGFTAPEDGDDTTDDLNGFVVAPEDGVIAANGVLTINADNPVAYIFFPAEEGQTITLTTSESSDSEEPLTDSMVYVFDAEGQRIAGSDDADGLFAATSVEAPDTGIYVAMVTSFGFWAAGEDPDNYTGVGDVVVALEVQ